jgi:hypothetical protein
MTNLKPAHAAVFFFLTNVILSEAPPKTSPAVQDISRRGVEWTPVAKRTVRTAASLRAEGIGRATGVPGELARWGGAATDKDLKR